MMYREENVLLLNLKKRALLIVVLLFFTHRVTLLAAVSSTNIILLSYVLVIAVRNVFERYMHVPNHLVSFPRLSNTLNDNMKWDTSPYFDMKNVNIMDIISMSDRTLPISKNFAPLQLTNVNNGDEGSIPVTLPKEDVVDTKKLLRSPSSEEIRLRKKQRKKEKKLRKRERVRLKKLSESENNATSIHVNETLPVRKDWVIKTDNHLKTEITMKKGNMQGHCSLPTCSPDTLSSKFKEENDEYEVVTHRRKQKTPPRFKKNTDDLHKQSLMNNFVRRISNEHMKYDAPPPVTILQRQIQSPWATIEARQTPVDSPKRDTLCDVKLSDIVKRIESFSLFTSANIDKGAYGELSNFRDYSLFGPEESNKSLVWRGLEGINSA